MLKVLNLVMPKTKINQKVIASEEDSFTLDNFRCRRMIEQVVKDHLPEAHRVAIIWLDKDDYVSAAYCNIRPLPRLWILFVAWLQELFDFRIDHHAKK